MRVLEDEVSCGRVNNVSLTRHPLKKQFLLIGLRNVSRNRNQIKFLSHPRVRGSPVIHPRSFLERKGLTKEEIDEAFRRFPDPPPSSQTTVNSQDGQQAVSNVQPQGQIQAMQPAPALSVSLVPCCSCCRSISCFWCRNSCFCKGSIGLKRLSYLH